MRAKDTDRALIIGGGIAGPALGIALRHAGIASVVYEASLLPRDSARAFLNLAPNGLNTLRAFGLTHLAVTIWQQQVNAAQLYTDT